MDDEEKKDQQGPQENDEHQSPFDQTGQVTDKAKQVGKKALKGLRGLGTAGATAEAGAGEATEVGAQAAEKSATKVATKALQMAIRAGGSNIGGWAVIIVIAVVFAMTILMAILGGQQATTATNYSTPPTTVPPIDYIPPCDQVDSSLTSLNIQTEDITDCGRKQLLYTTISKVFSFSRFKTLIGDRPVVFFAVDDGSLCSGDPAFWGCTKSGGKVLLKNFNDPKDNTPWQYVITHELFHVLGIRVGALPSTYRALHNSFIQKERVCYRINDTSSVIKTYDLDTKNIGESFAESGTLYVLGSRKSITNFQSECPNNYGFWLEAIGQASPPPLPTGGDTGQLVTFQIGNHTVTTNYRSSNSCPGKFYGNRQIDLSNTNKYPIGNFGDPNCDFSKDAVIELIKKLDPGDFIAKNGRRYKRYAVWDGIIHCESGYFPNALNRNSSSGWGAWGLFQMNPDFSGRAIHDNGTTDWRSQVENAIYRNNRVSDGGFGYWSCAGGFRRGTKDPRITETP